MSKDKTEAKKSSNYKKLKNFASSYYEEAFKTMQEIFQIQTPQDNKDPFSEKLIQIKLKTLMVFENFNWVVNIPTSTYYEASQGVQSLSDYLTSEDIRRIRFFVLPKKNKLDENMSDTAYSKAVRVYFFAFITIK